MNYNFQKPLFCILLAIMLLGPSLSASVIKFYHLNTSNGLSQNTINFIHQDKDGFFWFGTNGGLNKWNGYDFITFSHNPSDTTSIGQGRINCIYEEPGGELWIGTYQSGVSKFNKSTNSFTNYLNFETESKTDQSNNVLQINKIKNSIIVGTFGSGLYLLNEAKNTFTPITIKNELNESIKDLLIRKILIDKDSTMWVGHNKGILKIPNQNFDKENPILKGREICADKNVLSIYEDSKNLIWVGTHYSGAFYIKNDQIISINKKISSHQSTYPIIRDFIEDREKNIWIGTGGNGILVLDSTHQVVSHFKSQLNNIYSLASNIIYDLYIDNNQNLWVGTYNGGINYTSNHKQTFNHVRGYGENNGLKNNAILSICELSDNRIMIGTDGHGISVFNPTDNSFEDFSILNNSQNFTKHVPIVIEPDQKGNIIIGTFLNGLYVYNEKNKTLKNYRAGTGKYDLLSNDVWSVAVSKDNDIWVGTLGKGVARFDLETEQFHNFAPPSDSLHSISEDYISNLLIDHEGVLWIATYNGGLKMLLDEEKGLFRTFKKGDASGLSSNEIWKMHEDSRNKLWLTTHDGGVCILDRKTMTFKSITINDGMPSNSAQSIVEDKNGDIWIGSNKGLSKITINGDHYKIKNYTEHDGLQSNEFSSNAALNTTNNILFFGGNNGFNYFDPDKLVTKKEVGATIITDFLALYHNDIVGKTTSIINTVNKKLNAIEITHNISLITIEYAMLDYTIPELNTYQYKLEGFDKNWMNAGTNRKATYTNLDPGTYIFKVKGTNSLGVENKNIATIAFIIHPPFWKKNWFIALAIIFIILVVLLIYWYRERAYREQEKILKKKVDQRTKDLLSLNKVLALRNTEIKIQSAELKSKSEHLSEVNNNLEISKKQIENQNNELEQHRNNLEQLVVERTKELEKAKQKAEESEKLKMAFLANMSHEIRTPMNAIVGFSSLLSQEGYSNEERNTFTKLINTNSHSLLLLIDDILDLSRIEGNQLIISKKETNFNHLIQEIVESWKVINKEDFLDVNFEFENSIPDKDVIINNDSHRIKQVINNLIDNAFKFTSKGSVRLRIYVDNKMIITCVKDSGIGISKESLSVIFDRFRKSETSKDKEYRGAGLGLTISKKLANMLGGELWATSELGKGSEFYFQIPYK